jgi:hypothetical protein
MLTKGRGVNPPKHFKTVKILLKNSKKDKKSDHFSNQIILFFY